MTYTFSKPHRITSLFSIKSALFFATMSFLLSCENYIRASVIIDSNFHVENIRTQSKVLYSSHNMHIDSVYERMKQGKNVKPKPDFNDYIWIHFNITNRSAKEEFLLEINNTHIQKYELYTYDDNLASFTLISKGGSYYPFYERNIINRRFIESLPVKKNVTQTFILKIIDLGRSTSVSVRIWDDGKFHAHELRDALFYNLYFGGLIFISLLALVLRVILKLRLFYAYGLYALVMAIFMFDNLGFGYQYIYPNHPFIKRFFDVSFIPLLLLVFIHFSTCYFDAKKHFPTLYKKIKIFYICLASYLIFWIISQAQFAIYYYILLNYLFIASTFILLGILALKGYKHTRRKTLFYVSAIFFLFIGGFFLALTDAGYVPMEWFPTNPLLISSVIEFGIFTSALIYEVHRINKIKNHLILAAAKHQNKLFSAYIEGSEKVRTRLSGELHDNIGSRLALLKNRLLKNIPKESNVHTDVNDIYTKVRTLSHELSPGDFKIIGLTEYTEMYLTKFQSLTSIKVKFISHEMPETLSENMSGQLFRIIQEASRNVQKHAKASFFEVQLVSYDTELILTLDDDGIGFDTKNNTVEKYGITNMEARAKSLGGNFEISSEIGKGCHIMVTVPFTSKAN